MASYRGHLALSTPLGVAYGVLGMMQWDLDWGDAALGGGLCCVGGVLPDLDSDSSVPVREVFGIAAAVGALLTYARFRHGFNHEQAIVSAAVVYLIIRYFVAYVFKNITVHRGMWHSLPAMLCAGLGIYLLHPCNDPLPRIYVAGGAALGFLSHLVLDELYAVNLSGVTIKLNKFAGSALKFFSKSWTANLTCYILLGCLAFLAVEEPKILPMEAAPAVRKPMRLPRHRQLGNRPQQPAPQPMQPTPTLPVDQTGWGQPRQSPFQSPLAPPTTIPGPGRP